MGVYAKYVIPWAIHLTMKNKEATRHRQKVVPAARGRVLEVGIGSGLNLPFYGPEVSGVTGLDPSAELLGILRGRRRTSEAGFALDLIEGSAAAIPFADHDFDTVVTTWTLCSIDGAPEALAEMRRVLKPDGELVFIEHGRASEAGVSRWQDRLNPVWNRFSGGCNMNRDIEGLIRAAGFAVERLEAGYLIKGPRVLTYTYEGRARPR